MVVTLELIQQALHYERVVQRREGGYTVFAAVPDDERQESVELYFDERCEIVDMVSFGHWHSHFESSEDDAENIRRAMETARLLVSREQHVVNEYAEDGRYVGSCMVDPTGVPDTLWFDVKSFRRLVFGEAPKDEEIDFSRYHRSEHIWVELSLKERGERAYREAGMEPPGL